MHSKEYFLTLESWISYLLLCSCQQVAKIVFPSVESHMPVTNRLAIILDGSIYDVDTVDNIVGRYSNKGYTVVLHLKDEVNVSRMFARHFRKFVINDTKEVPTFLISPNLFIIEYNWNLTRWF